MKKYIAPSLEIINFTVADAVTLSVNNATKEIPTGNNTAGVEYTL